MKKLILVMVLAAAAAALSCNRGGSSEKATPDAAPEPAPAAAAVSSDDEVSPAGEKKTWIYFTKNYNKGTGPGQFNTDCIGIVGTDAIGTRRGYKVMWQVRQNNGGNGDDKCEGLDMGMVNLRFQTDVVGAAAMRKLQANSGGVIQGTVSKEDDDIGAIIAHKYQVYIGNTPAGPDPVIIVNCSSCGPDIP